MSNYRIAMHAAAFAVLMGSCQSILAGGGGTNLPTQITSSSPVMGDRLLRSGAGSSCGSLKAYPGQYGAGTYPYQTLGAVKVQAAGCVTFTFQTAGACGTNGVHLSAYDGVFNPRDLSVGYLGDSGYSVALGSNQPMSLDLANNQNIGLIVNSNDSGSFGPCAITVNTLDAVIPRTFTVFVGDVPSSLPPLTNRLYRDGAVSSCDVPKFFPGTNYGGGPYPYFKFVGTSPVAACAKVTASIAGSGCSAEQAHLSAYADAMDPEFLGINYLGDIGTSALIGAPSSMRVLVGANEPIILVANQIYNFAASPCTISLSAFDLVNDQVFANGFGG